MSSRSFWRLVPTDRSNWSCHKQKIEKWNQEFTALYSVCCHPPSVPLHLSPCSILQFLSWLKPQKMKAAGEGWTQRETRGGEKKRHIDLVLLPALVGGDGGGGGGVEPQEAKKAQALCMHTCRCVIAGEEGWSGSVADIGGTPKFKVAGAPAAERPPSLSQEKHITSLTPLIVFFCFVLLPLPVFICFGLRSWDAALFPHHEQTPML